MGHEYLRDFLAEAEKLGFTHDGFDGRGHPRLYHVELDIHTSVPYSPSDWRSRKNAIARLERLAGRKLPRDNRGKYRHRRVTQIDVRRSDQEQQCSQLLEELVEEAEQLRAEWNSLTKDADRSAASAARKVITRYSEIEQECSRMYRVIPPITGMSA